MNNRPMKPETIARRAKERAIETSERRADLLSRLQQKAATCGPDSIWAEMLLETLAIINSEIEQANESAQSSAEAARSALYVANYCK